MLCSAINPLRRACGLPVRGCVGSVCSGVKRAAGCEAENSRRSREPVSEKTSAASACCISCSSSPASQRHPSASSPPPPSSAIASTPSLLHLHPLSLSSSLRLCVSLFAQQQQFTSSPSLSPSSQQSVGPVVVLFVVLPCSVIVVSSSCFSISPPVDLRVASNAHSPRC